MDSDKYVSNIKCDEQIFALSFHPVHDVIATGHIDGSIEIWKYNILHGAIKSSNSSNISNNTRVLHNKTGFKTSCRDLKFSNDGEMLYAVSSDRSMIGINTNGSIAFNIPEAHNASINKMILLNRSNSNNNGSDKVMIATGDDIGLIKIWDIRTNKACYTFHKHEDYICDMTYNEDKQTLLTVGGDAALCAYDLRKPNSKDACIRSEDQEGELCCVSVAKGGRKVICGTQEGTILLFHWDDWEDCSDRFLGHPETVECFHSIDESTMLSGSSDGIIRVLSILPNKILGVLGDHGSNSVEGMCSSRDSCILGSYGLDHVVRFWDLSVFQGNSSDNNDGNDDDDDDDNDSDEGIQMDTKGEMNEDDDDEEDGKVVSRWNEDEELSSDSDMDDDDDDDDTKGGTSMKRNAFPSKAETFFSDL